MRRWGSREGGSKSIPIVSVCANAALADISVTANTAVRLSHSSTVIPPCRRRTEQICRRLAQNPFVAGAISCSVSLFNGLHLVCFGRRAVFVDGYDKK